MDHLIDSAEDVGLLVENGIIVRRLGDDAAVSKMINNLCVNIDTHTCFGDISQKLNDHYKSPFNRAIANLVLGYFPNIWIGTGTVAAAILLILTFIQTIQPFFCYPSHPHFDTINLASASNMEDYVSNSQKKGKGFDVVGSDSDIDYKDINNACTTNTERDDKLSASNKGKDKA
uniref:Uncharacterized protein n=1 Tax=Salix viminalis TaxID=40686 RepID=A0A6N2MTM1_SALVM